MHTDTENTYVADAETVADAPVAAPKPKRAPKAAKGPVYRFAAGGTPPRALADIDNSMVVRRTPAARNAAKVIDARCCTYLAQVRSGSTVAQVIGAFTAQGWHRRRETLRSLRDKGMVTIAAE